MLTAKKTLPLIIFLLIFFNSISSVWSRSVKKQTALAVMTLNVARFTNWPEHVFKNEGNTLNLCVFGDIIVQQSFAKINNKVINNKNIHITNLSRLRNVNQCQLLYLSELDQNRLTPLLMELEGQPILTIGESMDFLQAGGMVGLEKVNGKIKLNINLSVIKQTELVISSRLLKLANIVYFPSPAH